MRTTSFIPILATFLVLVFPFARADETRATVDRATESLLTGPGALSNLVVGVVRAGNSSFHRYGEVAADGPDEFEIASVTKPFTGLLLAKMVTDRKVGYEDAVRPCADSETTATCFNGTPVTFLHLVTHYSGLPATPTDHKGGRYTWADFERFLGAYKLTRAPGGRFAYSTVGFALLGSALRERAGAASFEELLTADVLQPLKLTRTRFSRTGGVANYASPSGGLVSTIDDLVRFVAFNLEPERAEKLGAAIRLTQVSDPSLKSIPPSIAARGWNVIQPMGYH
jgi:D-alanyl-D-alanine-carboxypeptidase/D-alanyl-D-alanine-endopeptidase